MKPVGVPLKEENGFRIDPKSIREKITDKTRLIIINSPNNPTGSVMSEEEITEVAKIAEEYEFTIETMEVVEDQVHVFKEAPPPNILRRKSCR